MIKLRRMRITKIIPPEAAIILALFAAFFLASLIIMPQAEGQSESVHYLSSFEKGAYGTSRLVSIAQNLGFTVHQHGKLITNEVLNNVGVIFALAPETAYSSSEKLEIMRWVNQGGILVYGSDIAPMLDKEIASDIFSPRGDIPLDILPPEIFRDELKNENPPNELKTSDGTVMMSSAKPYKEDVILSNVNEMQPPLFLFQGKLHRIVYRKEDLRFRNWEQWSESINPLVKERKGKDEGLEVDIGEDKEDKADEKWDLIAMDGENPLIIQKNLGNGKIICVSNPLIFANGYIDAGDNAIFAANLMALSGGKVCLFDEFRHGINEEKFNFLATGWGRSLIFLAVVGLLAIYSHAVRFIPPRSHPLPERRSQIEYLRSMANVLRRAKAYKLVAKILLRDYFDRGAKASDNPDILLDKLFDESGRKISEAEALSKIRSLIESKQELTREGKIVHKSHSVKGQKR